MQTSKNLMDEMGKIVRVVKPDVKLFIGDALAGNDTINQAREFFDYTNFDGAILTKVDADAKGGSAISIAHITSRPIIYIGMGQGYDDIIPFDSNKFIESLFESAGPVGMAVEDMTPMQKIPELAVEKVKSVEAQTLREEEKNILLLSKPAVNPLSSIDNFSRPEEQKVETIDPKPIVQLQPEPYKVKEQEPKEKKSRFGFFGKKRASEGRSKEEEEKGDNKENNKLQEKRAEEKGAEEEAQTRDKDRNLKEGKDTREQEDEKDKVVYLTDEDIEDLLK
jgi:fused signal recognition particle receptor